MKPARVVLIALSVASSATAAPSRECQKAKDQLANAQQRLAAERRLLQGCQQRLGSCTPGQMDGIREAIRGLTDEISDESRALQQACTGPKPPPRQDAIRIDDISPDAPYGQDSGGADPGGQIDAIAVDPTNDRIVYAGGETSGVWKSVDGGVGWAHASNGLGWGSTIDNGLAVDPSNPRRLLYATTLDDLGPGTASGGWGGHSGLYVSVDAAAHWSHVAIAGCVPGYQRVKFGRSAAYAATYACGIVTSTSAALDGWRSLPLPGNVTNIDDIAVGEDALFACAGSQVFKLTISSATWNPSPVTLPGGCYGLATVPDDDARFLAIVRVPDPQGNAVLYRVGVGNTATASVGFGLLPDLPAGNRSGHAVVVAIKRPSQPAGLGPGRSYTVLASNAAQLYDYQPPGANGAARWNPIDGIHVDIHGVAASSTCQVYVASDGGVSTNSGGSGDCIVSLGHFVRATHGLHAYGTFGMAGAPGTSAVLYAPSNDNGIWATAVSRAGATAWGDMGSDIGETGITFLDPGAPGRFFALRGNDLYVWTSGGGAPPLPGAGWSKIAICPLQVPCAADRVTQVLTLPGQRAAANGDFLAIRHNPTSGSYALFRNTAGRPEGWVGFGGSFPARAVDVQVANGHEEPYVYVLADDGDLYRGHLARDPAFPSGKFTGWDKITTGVPRIASFSVDPYRPNVVYAFVIGDPTSLADDSIQVASDATAAAPTWRLEANLTRMASLGGRYRLACGDGAAGAPPAGTLNWGENHGYRYECALNQVVFVPQHPEMRFAILSAGVAFTRDSGATWRDLGGTSPLARPVAAFYDPTVVPGSNLTNLYVALRGHGVIRIQSRFTP